MAVILRFHTVNVPEEEVSSEVMDVGHSGKHSNS